MGAGDLIYAGLNSAGQSLAGGIGDALTTYENNKKQDAFNDQMFDYLKTVPGAVPADALMKYHDMNRNQKNAVILSAQFALKNRQDTQAAEDKRRLDLSKANYYIMRGAQDKAADNSPLAVDPYYDPVTKKPVPGLGLVRKTGAVVDTRPISVNTDPNTGISSVTGKNVHVINPAQAATAKAFQAASQPTPTPTPGGDTGGPNMLQRFLIASGLGRAPATPAPTPTATPNGAPAPGGAPGAAPGDQDLRLQQARSAISRGADPEAVKSLLQQRGIDPNLL